MPAPARTARPGWRLAALAVPVLLLAGCGGGAEPEPLEPMTPAVPADLCSVVPDEARAGLEVTATSDDSGNPTAACALRSADGAAPVVRAVVTWTQFNDEEAADLAYASQCRSVDPADYEVLGSVAVEGVEEACGGRGTAADRAVLAAVTSREVLTVRWESEPAGRPAAFDRAVTLAGAVATALEPASPSS